MTLIVIGMIGEYAFISANRNRNHVYDKEKKCMVLTPLTKKESKILIVNDTVLVGSCNVRLLKKYNKYFSNIAKNNPDYLIDSDIHLEYFKSMSDCERVNYFLLFRSKSNQIYHKLYCQTGETSHEVHTLKMSKGRNDSFCLIPPFDLDGQEFHDRLDYLLSQIPDKSVNSIIDTLKQLYTECSDVSPFVTSGFHLAILHTTEPDIFKFIDN